MLWAIYAISSFHYSFKTFFTSFSKLNILVLHQKAILLMRPVSDIGNFNRCNASALTAIRAQLYKPVLAVLLPRLHPPDPHESRRNTPGRQGVKSMLQDWPVVLGEHYNCRCSVLFICTMADPPGGSPFRIDCDFRHVAHICVFAPTNNIIC